MTVKKSKLRRDLDSAARMLLKDAFPRNNPSKATAHSTPPDGAAPTSPDLAERSRVFKAVVDYLALSEKLDKGGSDEPDSGSGGTLSDLQRQLGPTPGGSAFVVVNPSGWGCSDFLLP